MNATILDLGRRLKQRERLTQRLAPLAVGPAPDDRDEATAAPLPHWLRLRLDRADLMLSRRAAAFATSAVAAMMIAGAMIGGILLAAALAVAALVGTLLVIEWRAARNVQAFVTALPLFLDSMQQLLRVGNSLHQAFTKASAGASPATARFLFPAVHRLQHGMSLAESLGWAAERVEIAELRMFAAAVAINGRHGGSISSTLANLARLLRQATRVQRELKAATAETRFSGLVLGAMPLLLTAVLTMINPGYTHFFLDTPEGRRLAVIALGLQLTGMALMHRLMRLSF